MILACLDGSAYGESVCDHAAWLASRTDDRVEVLHALEPAAALDHSPPRIISAALERLTENGVAELAGQARQGQLVDLAAVAAPDLIVIGKRGLSSAAEPRVLGSCVEPIIRGTSAPVCLAPRLFLPISRVLVLLDADVGHTRATEFLARHPGLADLEANLVVICDGRHPAAEKLEWARAALAGRDARIFTMSAGGLDEAVMQYMQSQASDLIVVSRAVLLPDPDVRLRQLEADSFWGWRTPVIVC